MRFPLSHDGGHGDYIARNKIRPKPEWQKTAVADAGRRPIRSRSFTRTPNARAQAASDDQQALPAGDDAGAAARLQSDLHRLRPHSRIRIHHYAERCRCEQCLKAVDECGAPIVSICGGEPMLLSRDRRRWPPKLMEREQDHLALHQRHVHPEAAEGIQARRQVLLQRPPGRHGEESRHRGGARGRFPRSHRGRQGRQSRPASRFSPTPRSTKRPT